VAVCASDAVTVLYVRTGSRGAEEVGPAEVRRRYGVQHSHEIPVQQYDAAVTDVARGPGEP